MFLNGMLQNNTLQDGTLQNGMLPNCTALQNGTVTKQYRVIKRLHVTQ
jgi:hypothetical protein